MHVHEFSAAACSLRSYVTYWALQKYMHEFHADRDHAMCNIQTRSIPAVQLIQLRKLSNKNFQGTGILQSTQSCQVPQWQHDNGGAWLKL
jgi:hypothetical protein